jgi:pimeloyl-ACP methyl ester carboxylesterase/catechol 2,3-dioxygenase-like lactoylglutathione lyase family enzyme
MARSTPVSGFVSVTDVRLHYLDYGGNGPPAVLHHATGFHAWVWTPIAEALSTRYRVFALDARGHGDSEKPAAGYRWETFISDLVAFVQALGLGRVLGVGHSLGATTTAGAAADRPDLFRVVAILDPILFPREFRDLSMAENPMASGALKRREVWPSHEEVLASYRGRGPFVKWRDDVLRLYVDHGFAADADGGVRLKCPPTIEAQVFRMAPEPGFDGWKALERLTVPALLLRGAESDAFSASDAEAALARLTRGELRTLRDTTHMFPMEEPEAVAAEILGFAERELPIATRGLAHVALKVVKLEETVRFYQDVFGMRIVWQPDADNVYLSSGRDNLALHRTHAPRAAQGSRLDHLGFFVDSAEHVFAIAGALSRNGIGVVRPPRRHRDGSCSLYLEDPDGNAVQVLFEPNALRE